MTILPFIKRQYLTNIQREEIIDRVERTVVKPDKQVTFQKIIENHILEGKATNDGFIVVMGRYGLTYGKTSLLPYLIARFKPKLNDKTRLQITIQPSLGIGLIILSTVYILAVFIIYISWTKNNLEGIIISGLLIVITYLSMLLKFNKEMKTYLDYIENVILNPETTLKPGLES
jgi:hypothetical protein